MNTKPATFTLPGITCISILVMWMVLIIWNLFVRGPIEPPIPVDKMQLKAIALAIQLYSVDHDGLPKGVEYFGAVEWYQVVRKYVSDSPTWDKGKKLVDYWECDYQFKVSVTTNERAQSISEIKIWSCGPIHKNEQGQGDDIAVTVQVRP